MLILDLRDIVFHAVVVFGLGKNLLFKYLLGRCAYVVVAWRASKQVAEALILIKSRLLPVLCYLKTGPLSL